MFALVPAAPIGMVRRSPGKLHLLLHLKGLKSEDKQPKQSFRNPNQIRLRVVVVVFSSEQPTFTVMGSELD